MKRSSQNSNSFGQLLPNSNQLYVDSEEEIEEQY